MPFCANCFQLCGVDLILDSQLQPRVIELNGEPSMKQTGSKSGNHYDATKRAMSRDLVRLLFSREDAAPALLGDLARVAADATALSDHELQYLLETAREAENMRGFRRLYPAHRDAGLYGDFLRVTNATEGRMHLHAVASQLEGLRVARCRETGASCSSQAWDLTKRGATKLLQLTGGGLRGGV